MFKEKSIEVPNAESVDVVDKWKSIILNSKLSSSLVFPHTHINGTKSKSEFNVSLIQCEDICLKDAHCVAYTYSIMNDESTFCHFYSERKIYGLLEDKHRPKTLITLFLPK